MAAPELQPTASSRSFVHRDVFCSWWRIFSYWGSRDSGDACALFLVPGLKNSHVVEYASLTLQVSLELLKRG